MKLFKLLALAGISFSLAACNIAKKAPSSSSESSSIVEPSSSSSSSSESSSSSSEPEVLEGMSPEEAIADVASYFGGSPALVEEGVYGVYGAFPAASYSVEDMKGYVSSLFVPEEFELISDWAESNGAETCSFINAIATVLQFYVYGETLWVDDEGYIVDEGTEGATAVEATCIEVYSFTYSE